MKAVDIPRMGILPIGITRDQLMLSPKPSLRLRLMPPIFTATLAVSTTGVVEEVALPMAGLLRVTALTTTALPMTTESLMTVTEDLPEDMEVPTGVLPEDTEVLTEDMEALRLDMEVLMEPHLEAMVALMEDLPEALLTVVDTEMVASETVLTEAPSMPEKSPPVR